MSPESDPGPAGRCRLPSCRLKSGQSLYLVKSQWRSRRWADIVQAHPERTVTDTLQRRHTVSHEVPTCHVDTPPQRAMAQPASMPHPAAGRWRCGLGRGLLEEGCCALCREQLDRHCWRISRPVRPLGWSPGSGRTSSGITRSTLTGQFSSGKGHIGLGSRARARGGPTPARVRLCPGCTPRRVWAQGPVTLSS
jgi:hypothetical protein